MIDYFRKLFDTSDYPARWTCGNWSSMEGWIHIVADSLIFVAYAAIPASIFALVWRKREVTFPAVAWLFIGFILFCGVTHLVEATLFWWPAYRFSGVMKVMTAGVSLTTAVVLVRLLPEAVKLPSIREANAELQASLARERVLTDELQKAHEQLQSRSSDLVVRERKLRLAVTAARACAVNWDVETGVILWTNGYGDMMRAAGLDWQRELTEWSVLLGDEGSRRLRERARAVQDEDQVLHELFELPGARERWAVRLRATLDPPVQGQARTMSGMFGLSPVREEAETEEE